MVWAMLSDVSRSVLKNESLDVQIKIGRKKTDRKWERKFSLTGLGELGFRWNHSACMMMVPTSYVCCED